MVPGDEDRIDIRKQQIEELRDLIAWEKAHKWGNGSDFREVSDQIVKGYEQAIALLEIVIARLEARMARH